MRKKVKNTQRFYVFENDKNHYCFDSINHKIFLTNDFLSSLIKNNNVETIRKKYTDFYKKVIRKRPKRIIPPQVSECNVTINPSNNCNLNCKYCYRDKNLKAKLSNEDLEKIISYVKKCYYPKANQYNFSLSYTSESSLDLKVLRYFDYLIGENEGYLFSKNEISKKNLWRLFQKLPLEIRSKYDCKKISIDTINEILKKEHLWEVYDWRKESYLKTVLYEGIDFSVSRKIMVNRIILNLFFPEFKLERPIQYCSLSFMTNGTYITDEYVDFVKSILLDTIYVSLDGPEEIHNTYRRDNSEGTYKRVLEGIDKLRKSKIKIIPSVVITPEYPDLEKIVTYLCSQGFTEICFNLVRGTLQFSKDSIDKLLNSIRNLFERFFKDCTKGIYSVEFEALKNSMLFTPLKSLYFGDRFISRCTWGKDLIIDPKGNMYHCNSTIDNRKDFLGHYSQGRKRERFMRIPSINDNKVCSLCVFKYLCGGTCYADIINNNTANVEMECYFKKELIKENMRLYANLYQKNLLKDFINNLEKK